MSSPKVIFIHGPAASGKFTIARELARLTGLPLFHNHLTVDLLLALFPFGSPEFIHHRERIWKDLMTDAIAGGSSLIFTFHPESSVNPDFPHTLQSSINEAGGHVHFVEIQCSEEELERRLESTSRREFRKLSSTELYRQLKGEGAFEYPAIPSECMVNSSQIPPEQSARAIAMSLHLSFRETP